MRKIGEDTKIYSHKTEKDTSNHIWKQNISLNREKKCLLDKNVQNLPLSKTLGCLITLTYHEINIPQNVQP